MTAWMAQEQGCPEMDAGEKSEYREGSKTNSRSGSITMGGIICAFGSIETESEELPRD
jgi:hypothetical protein